MSSFPKNFLWGASASAYQVEGNNSNSDWWHWEKSKSGIISSGAACGHYERFREDFDLAKSLGHNTHRFSIEWSRVQPESGKFSQEQFDHYSEVIDYLLQLGIEPVVTLHHFTNPLWLGSWADADSFAGEYFLAYVQKVVQLFAGRVKYWVTINEPMVYTYHSYIKGDWPPQEKSFIKAGKVIDILAAAHSASYHLIHSFYEKNNLPPPHISIAQNLVVFTACKKSLRNNLAVYLRNRLFNFKLIEKLTKEKVLDFIGVNYYTRNLIDSRSWSIKELLINTCGRNHDNLPKNSLGWEIYPQGLYDLLMALKKYKLPVFILENGVCTEDDNVRWDYIREHLQQLRRALDSGVNVIGYLYWSLLDNFEWDKGFGPRFGLCAVDANFKRTPRASAKKFARTALTGALEE